MPTPRIAAKAPGKLFLSGEYAVLEGAPALACAVSRQVTASFLSGGAGEAPAAAAWRRGAHGILRRHGLDPAPAEEALEIDSRALYTADGIKLGLGSSAAVAVAVSGLLLAAQDQPAPAPPAHSIAGELHAAVRGSGGSGVDVAASFHGGVIAVEKDRVERLHWPQGLHCAVIFTGRDADTGSAIARFQRALRGGARKDAEGLCAAAKAVRRAWNRDAPTLLAGLDGYSAAWRKLDRSAGLGVFSPEHRRLQELSREAGCVYKPSGAGGGDCGLAFSHAPGQLKALVRNAGEQGFQPLDVDLGVEGLQLSP